MLAKEPAESPPILIDFVRTDNMADMLDISDVLPKVAKVGDLVTIEDSMAVRLEVVAV
jgi:hypothetical protein